MCQPWLECRSGVCSVRLCKESLHGKCDQRKQTTCGIISPFSFQPANVDEASREDSSRGRQTNTPMVESPCARGVDKSSLVIILFISVQQFREVQEINKALANITLVSSYLDVYIYYIT